MKNGTELFLYSLILCHAMQPCEIQLRRSFATISLSCSCVNLEKHLNSLLFKIVKIVCHVKVVTIIYVLRDIV